MHTREYYVLVEGRVKVSGRRGQGGVVKGKLGRRGW